MAQRYMNFNGNLLEGSLQENSICGPNTLGEYFKVVSLDYDPVINKTRVGLDYWNPEVE